MSALKALIMNKDLYADKPKADTTAAVPELAISDVVENDDWAAFSSTEPVVLDDQRKSSVTEPNATMGFFVDSVTQLPQVNTAVGDSWVEAAVKPGPNLTSAVGWDGLPVADPSIGKIPDSDLMSHCSKKREPALKVDKVKSEKLFAKNLVNTKKVICCACILYIRVGAT